MLGVLDEGDLEPMSGSMGDALDAGWVEPWHGGAGNGGQGKGSASHHYTV
jgi:hypothetical protein